MEVLHGHQGAVHALRFSPGDGSLVSGGQDGSLRIWTLGGEQRELSKGSAAVHSIAFSAEGRWLAAGDAAGELKLWDMNAHAVAGHYHAHGRIVTGLAFLPDDATVVFALSGESLNPKQSPGVHFWDWRQIKTRLPPVDVATLVSVKSVAAVAEKRLLAWATEKRSIEVWNLLQSNKTVYPLKSGCRALALSPDGKTLAAAIDWKIHLFELEYRRERLVLAGHKGAVSAVAFSPDGRSLLSGSWDRTIRTWNTISGHETASFEWPVGRVQSAEFAPDGLRAAVAGDDGSIVIWDID